LGAPGCGGGGCVADITLLGIETSPGLEIGVEVILEKKRSVSKKLFELKIDIYLVVEGTLLLFGGIAPGMPPAGTVGNKRRLVKSKFKRNNAFV
jgi:hypothetical protein